MTLTLATDTTRPPPVLPTAHGLRCQNAAAEWAAQKQWMRIEAAKRPRGPERSRLEINGQIAACWQHYWTWMAGGQEDMAEEFRLGAIAGERTLAHLDRMEARHV